MNEEQPTQGAEFSCATKPAICIPPSVSACYRRSHRRRPSRDLPAESMCFDVEHVPVSGPPAAHRPDGNGARRDPNENPAAWGSCSQTWSALRPGGSLHWLAADRADNFLRGVGWRSTKAARLEAIASGWLIASERSAPTTSTSYACGKRAQQQLPTIDSCRCRDIEHRRRNEGRIDCGLVPPGVLRIPVAVLQLAGQMTPDGPLVPHPARHYGRGAGSYRAGDGRQLLTLGCLGIVKWPRRERPGGLEHALPGGFIDLVRRWGSKLRETVEGCTPAATATSRIVTAAPARRTLRPGRRPQRPDGELGLALELGPGDARPTRAALWRMKVDDPTQVESFNAETKETHVEVASSS
jgi:hypothetical protein